MKSFFSKLWAGTKTTAKRVGTYARKHKIIAGIVVVVIIGLCYWAYTALAAGSAATEYTLAAATQGSLQVTVTGSGQVAADDNLNVTPQGSASGQITALYVKPGQKVTAGTALAQLDETNAAQSLASAKEDYESAEISYQQSITSSQTNQTGDQSNAVSDITTTYTNVPPVMTGFDTILHALSTITGYTAEQNIDAYANYVSSTQAQLYRAQVAEAYTAAVSSYQTAQGQYASSDVHSLSTTQTEALAKTTIQALTDLDTALNNSLTYYNYINAQLMASKTVIPTQITSQIASLTTYQNTVSSDLTNLTSAEQALEKDGQTLSGGTTPLDIQSAQLSMQKAQTALSTAETNAADYTVRAPFDGTIATVPVHQYDQASSGTTVAILITDEEYADLSLNETDVAKVVVGQPVALTFDALPNVTMQGTVATVDPVGTVTQGVVSYDVKISFNTTNAAIKPGMTFEATIVTADVADAVQVPSAAVTTVGTQSYIQVATLKNASSTAAARMGTSTARRTRTSTSTPTYGAGRTSSTTASSTTRAFTGTSGSFASTGLTVPESDVTVARVPVTLGISNDTMVQITSGLKAGQFIVTGTTNGARKTTTTSTSLLGGLFGGGAKRATGTTGTPTGAATAGRTTTFTGSGGGFSGGGGAGFSGRGGGG